MIATIAVETGIAPSELLSLSPRMLFTIQRYMIYKYHQQSKR